MLSLISLKVLALRLALSYVLSLAFLKPQCSNFHCPTFPLISQSPPPAIASASRKQPTNQSIPHQKTSPSSLSDSCISSGKQRGEATVLGEERDIVTGETCSLLH
jgi:hypothetical protein